MQLLYFLAYVFIIFFVGYGVVTDPTFRLIILALTAMGTGFAVLVLHWQTHERGTRYSGRQKLTMLVASVTFVLSGIWFNDLVSYRSERILFYTAMPPIQEQQYLSLGCYGWKATKADEGGVLDPEFINQPRVLIWKQGEAGHPYYEEAYRIPQGVLFCSFFNQHGSWGHLDWKFVPWENFDFRLRRALREAPEVKLCIKRGNSIRAVR